MQVHTALPQIGGQSCRQGLRIHFFFVITGEIAAEQFQLKRASQGVLLAVQGQQHPLHEHVAFAVHRLHKATIAQGFECLLIVVYLRCFTQVSARRSKHNGEDLPDIARRCRDLFSGLGGVWAHAIAEQFRDN